MKQCPKCQEVKLFEAFYASSTHKTGYASWCKPCESERNRLKTKKYRDSRLAKAKQWRDENKEKQAEAIRVWREQNPEKLKAIYKEWAQQNRDKVNAKWMKRDAAKKNRTPSWLTEDDLWIIEQAYDIAIRRSKAVGIAFHVDHIVPLQGKTVSGLHVPWNLQVIPAKQNQSKSNSWKGN